MNLIRGGQFAVVSSNKDIGGTGLKAGDEVFVWTMKQTPYLNHNPYVIALWAGVTPVFDNTPIQPVKENEEGQALIIIDPNKLSPLSEERDKKLWEILEKDFATTD